MTRFELRTSGIGSERSTNWATTTAHVIVPTEVLCKQKTFRNTFEISAKVFELLLLHKRWNEAFDVTFGKEKNFAAIGIRTYVPLIVDQCAHRDFISTNNCELIRDGGQVVSVFAFYSDHPSSKPAEVHSFNIDCVILLQNKCKKRPRWSIWI